MDTKLNWMGGRRSVCHCTAGWTIGNSWVLDISKKRKKNRRKDLECLHHKLQMSQKIDRFAQM